MSGDALVGLGGVVVGALIAALISLWIARQSQGHVERLAADSRDDQRAAEARALRTDAYRDLARLVSRVEVDPIDMGVLDLPTHAEILDMTAWVRAVGSSEMRRAVLEFASVATDGVKDGDDRERLFVACSTILAQIHKEITPLADFSAAEKPE